MFFKDRQDAGRQLSLLLKKYENADAVVYALPQGGVIVAAEIALFLHAPLDLILAHKIGRPYQPENAVAAISEGGYLVEPSGQPTSAGTAWLESEKERQIAEIKRKREKYLKGKKEIPVKGKIALLVDDGIATGLTMLAGIKELKERQPKKIIVVAPIAPKSTATLIKMMADEFIGIEIDDNRFLGAVGSYYDEFDQVEDAEVIDVLNYQTEEYNAHISNSR